MNNRVTRYFFRILVSIDQLANTLLGGRPDETISGNVGYNAKEGKALGAKNGEGYQFSIAQPYPLS